MKQEIERDNNHEHQLSIEIKILKEMGLPYHCMTLDGDHVISNNTDYNPSDEEMLQFRDEVQKRLVES